MTLRVRLLAMALLPATLLAGCLDGAVRMKGRVRDSYGDPLPGATVTVPDLGEFQSVAVTDSSGHFEYFSLCDPRLRSFSVAIEHEGFKPAFIDSVPRSEVRLHVVLAPDSAATGSRARLVAGDAAPESDAPAEPVEAE